MTKVFNVTESDIKKLSSNDIMKNFDDILAKLEDVDKKYSTGYSQPKLDIPPSLNLEKLNYDMPTQDELYRIAEESLKSKKQDSLVKADDSLMKSTNSIDSKVNTLLNDAKIANQLLDSKAGQLKAKTISEAINRGTGRSSIVSEGVKKVDSDISSMKTSNETNKQNTIDLLNEQINKLIEMRDKTVSDVENSFMLQADEKTAQLLNEANKKKDDTEKYNNTIDEKETKYVKSVEESYAKAVNDEWNRVNKNLELEAKYGQSGVNNQKLDEKVNLVKSFLSTLDKESAKALLEGSSAFSHHLKQYYSYVQDFVDKM